MGEIKKKLEDHLENAGKKLQDSVQSWNAPQKRHHCIIASGHIKNLYQTAIVITLRLQSTTYLSISHLSVYLPLFSLFNSPANYSQLFFWIRKNGNKLHSSWTALQNFQSQLKKALSRQNIISGSDLNRFLVSVKLQWINRADKNLSPA
jgi:hypothetical protein